MSDSEEEPTTPGPRRGFTRAGLLNIWTVSALAAWTFLGTEGLRPVPELEELAKVTAPAERLTIKRTKLSFWLEGVEQKFVVDAERVDTWYALVEACEQGAVLTLWTWPAVLENRPWPLASYYGRMPWQVEHDGELLVGYGEESQARKRLMWFLRSLFLALTAGLAWWMHRKLRPKTGESRRTRRRKRSQGRTAGETHEPGQGNTAARWFWNILGLAVGVMVVVGSIMERSSATYPVPERANLVEKTGIVTGVEVDVIRTSSGRSGGSTLRKISGISFGLEGEQGRWSINKYQWRYELLARQLVPGASVRILVLGPQWLAAHGEPPSNEDLWSVVVGEESLLSLEQQLSVVNKRRERKTSPLLLVFVAVVVSACFIQGYRVGRTRS